MDIARIIAGFICVDESSARLIPFQLLMSCSPMHSMLLATVDLALQHICTHANTNQLPQFPSTKKDTIPSIIPTKSQPPVLILNVLIQQQRRLSRLPAIILHSSPQIPPRRPSSLRALILDSDVHDRVAQIPLGPTEDPLELSVNGRNHVVQV
jgi:hypothetical protein